MSRAIHLASSRESSSCLRRALAFALPFHLKPNTFSSAASSLESSTHV